jgi:hypothetical protein
MMIQFTILHRGEFTGVSLKPPKPLPPPTHHQKNKGCINDLWTILVISKKIYYQKIALTLY